MLVGKGHWLLPLGRLLLQGHSVALLVDTSKNYLGGEAGVEALTR